MHVEGPLALASCLNKDFLIQLNLMTHICNLATQEAGVGGSQIQDQAGQLKKPCLRRLLPNKIASSKRFAVIVQWQRACYI